MMNKSAEAATIRQWLSSIGLVIDGNEEEFGKFIVWAQAKLASLDATVSRRTISDVVRSQELFPSADGFMIP